MTTVRGLQAKLAHARKAPQYRVEELESARRRHFKAIDDVNVHVQLFEMEKETRTGPIKVQK